MKPNEAELERILRSAPKPKANAGLKDQLAAQITLPTAKARAVEGVPIGGLGGWLRRWWPALAPASVSLACAVVMVVQQIEAREVRQSNQTLVDQLAKNSTAITAPSPIENRNQAEAAEQKEIARLKERATQLGSEVARLEAMRSENETLRKQPLPSASGLTEDELAAMAKAKERAQSIACINNLKQIGLAVRMWQLDHKNVCPPDFLSMSNELNTPKILACPGDTNRLAATTFAKYSDENCSYEYLTPSAKDTDAEPQRVLTRCPIHGHIGLCDGSVEGYVGKTHPERLVLNDNKLYFESAAPGK